MASIRRHKLLSSGVTKGRVGRRFVAAMRFSIRRGDAIPPQFWTGWQLAIVRDDGHEIDQANVTAFDPAIGRLQLSGLSASPTSNASYELRCDLDAPVIAIRYHLGTDTGESQCHPSRCGLGTTRGTNALVTRSGARTALVTTRGFGDVLEIGYQARPRLFDLTVRKPPVLTAAIDRNR